MVWLRIGNIVMDAPYKDSREFCTHLMALLAGSDPEQLDGVALHRLEEIVRFVGAMDVQVMDGAGADTKH